MTDRENLAIYSHGKFLMQWQRLDRARIVAEGLVTLSPDFAYGWFLLSELYPGEQGLAYAKRALDIEPENMELAFHYCRLEISTGAPSNAKAHLIAMSGREDHWGPRAKLMLRRI